MNEKQIIEKTQNAAKWSTITEICTRCISPITQMILARILAPEIFGIVATVNMVISFTEIFADAGFQKYIVQHEFSDEDELNRNSNVAFWTNFSISILLWFVIVLFRNSIAKLVGAEGLGTVIAIACVQIPLMAFSSLQLAIYRRKFSFRSLFYMRLVISMIPLVITIPLAMLGLKYWALIIGNISSIVAQAVILTAKSSWKPKFYFSLTVFKEMFSFGVWSMFEAVAIWLTAWVDSLVVGSILNSYYLGLYNTSLNMVNSVMAIVTTAVTPVLFSSLSRAQFENKVFNQIFLSTQKIMAYLLLPIGAGIFLYRDLATSILLGSEWSATADIIGIWAIAKAIRTIMVSINSEAYRAKGLPKLSLFLQIVDLIILIPSCFVSIRNGFDSLVLVRALIMGDLIIPGLIVMQRVIKISAKDILRNLVKPVICTLLMALVALILQKMTTGVLWDWISIFACVIIYGCLLWLVDRKMVTSFVANIRNRNRG